MIQETNILFIIADDASHFGCYGHSFVKTPNIDSLAKNGLLFNNMFTTNPKCAPSRASILSGKHTWQLGEACNHQCYFPGKEELKLYPEILEENGVHVGFTGKGWGPGDYTTKGRTNNPAGKEYNKNTLTPPNNSNVSNKDYHANFIDFLNAKSDSQPFCFWFGAHEPHRKYTPKQGLLNGKSMDEISEVPPYWPDHEIVRSDMLDYAFEIEWFDKQVGLMVDELECRGELENTLIMVTSDNGCPFPRVKGQMFDDDFRLPFVAHWPNKFEGGNEIDFLCSFVDLLPTFYEINNIPIPSELPGSSLLEIFSASESKKNDRSRAYMGRERHDYGREDDLGYPVRCIRTPEFLLCVNYEPNRWPAGNPETGFTNCDSSPTKDFILDLQKKGHSSYFDQAFAKRPKFQLFDIKEDPYCMSNLSENENFKDLQSHLLSELNAYLKETKDPRFLENKDIFEQYKLPQDDLAKHSWSSFIQGTFQPQKY